MENIETLGILAAVDETCLTVQCYCDCVQCPDDCPD